MSDPLFQSLVARDDAAGRISVALNQPAKIRLILAAVLQTLRKLTTCAAIAPAKRSRQTLVVATEPEGAVSAYVFIHLFVTCVS